MDPRSDFSQNLTALIQEELRKVDCRFEAEIKSIMCQMNFDPDRPVLDMHLYYPFWLSYSFDLMGQEDVAEKLARFNFWFGFHTFIQDDLVDKRPLEIYTHKRIIFSDYILLKSLAHLEELAFKTTLELLNDVVCLYGDYIHCILWEKERSDLSSPSEANFEKLGKKFSMLKVNNVVFAGISGRTDILKDLNSFLENYHICMQLIDDIKDWRIDLECGNTSYFLNEVLLHSGACDDLEELDRLIAYSGFTRRTVEKAMDYLRLARSNVKYLHNPYINGLLDEGEDFLESIIKCQELNIEELIDEVASIL